MVVVFFLTENVVGNGRWWRGLIVQVAAASARLSSKKVAVAALPAWARTNTMAACPQESSWVCSGYHPPALCFSLGLLTTF